MSTRSSKGDKGIGSRMVERFRKVEETLASKDRRDLVLSAAAEKLS